MINRDNNRLRALADVVSIDAWHAPFGDAKLVDLHADVVFGTARVGGEENSPVRFRLRVKRADVLIIIPDTEPLAVAKNTVARDTPQLPTRLTKSIERTAAAGLHVDASGSVSPLAISGQATIAARGDAEISAKQTLQASAEIQFMIVTQSKTSEGHYRWSVSPFEGEALDGRPWDSLKSPRLKLIDQRRDKSKSLPPCVRVEVSCRREDLIIDDLQVKDESLWQSAQRALGFANKKAAAESYIRDQLTKEGLHVRNIADIFGQLTLASAIAEASP